MPYIHRMLIDGLIAMSIAVVFLFEWYGKDHEVLMTAMSIGLLAMMTGDDVARSSVRLWEFVKQRREDD